MRLSRIGLLAVVFLALLSCKDNPTSPVGKTPGTIEIAQGDGQTATVGSLLPQSLVALVKDKDGRPVSGVTVEFRVRRGGGTIEPSSVLTDETGRARANWTLGGTAGTQEITAVLGQLPALSFLANATPDQPALLRLLPDSLVFDAIGDSAGVAATVRDRFENVLPGAAISWSSSNPAVVSVSPEGRLTSRGAGVADITASSGIARGIVRVRVNPTLESVTLAQDTATLTALGDTLRLVPAGRDRRGVAIPNLRYEWRGLDELVATVDTLGKITARGNGEARIVVTSGGRADTARITVRQIAVGLRIVPGQRTINAIGDTVALRVDRLDRNGFVAPSSDPVTWRAADASLVTVSASGLVISRAVGQTRVFASVGAQTDSTSFTVRQVIALIAMVSPGNLPAGTQYRVHATASDSNGVNVPVATFGWVSSDTAVAKVDVGGQVTVRRAGQSEIRATAPAMPGGPMIVGRLMLNVIAGDPAVMTIVSGDGQGATASTALFAPLTVRVTDAFGNAVAGRQVQWNVIAGGGSVNPILSTVGADGIATTQLTVGATAGINTVQAITGGGVSVNFTSSSAGAIGAAGGVIRVPGDLVVITIPAGALTGPTALTVMPATGSPADPTFVPGTAFEFGPSGTTFATPVQVKVTYNPALIPTGTTEAQLKLHRVTNGTWRELTGNVVDEAANTVTAPLSSFSTYGILGERTPTVLNASPSPITLNTIGATQQITVTVRDADGNVLDQRGFTFTSANPAVATVSSSGLVTAAGSGNTTVTVRLGALSAIVAVEVTQVATTVTVAPGATTLTALGATQQLTASVYDANGVLMPTAPVTWGSSNTAAAMVSSTGLATAVSNGTATMTATSGTASGTATVTVAQAPATMAVQAGNAQSATVQTAVATRPAVIVRDANGHPVAGVSVTFAVTGGGGNVTGGVQVTGADGIATVGSWTLGAVAGPNSLGASAGALNAAFTATGTADAAATMTKTAGDAQTAVAGTAVSIAPTVRVVDALGNPVAGVTVTFSVTAGGGNVTGGTQTTDASGNASVGAWTLGNTAGNNQLGVAVTGVTSVIFNATGTAGAPAQLVKISGDGGTLVVAGTRTLQARVLDALGNGVAGQTVTWAAATGSGSVSAPTSVSDATGLAVVDWTAGTTAGAQSATATLGSITGSPATFALTALPGAASAANSSISALPATITADGASTAAITVRARDQYNNDLQTGGATVVLSKTGGGTLSLVTDAGNGTYNATLTAPTVVGSATITATLNGNPVPGSPGVTFTAGPLTNFLVESQGGGPIGTQLVGASFNIRITARDAFNNTVTAFGGGADITSTGTLATGAGPTATFTAGVLASHALSFSAPGTVTITATRTAGSEAGTSAPFIVEGTPVVTTTTPVNGATGVTSTANLGVTFNEPVNVSGNWFQIGCPTSGTRNPGDASISGGPTAFTINPNADFASGETCTVTIFAAQVSDQDANDPPDNPVANHVFSFTVDAAPVVSSTLPLNAATGITTNASLSITFSEPVTVIGTWFEAVCTVSGTRNPANATVSGGPTTFSIDPATDFTQGESCTVTVFAAQVSDVDTNDDPDHPPANHVFSFTVDAAPAVTSTAPVAAAILADNGTLTVNFSEAVSATTSSFTLECPAGTPRSYTLSSSPASSFTLTPTAALPGGACRLTVIASQISDVDASDPPDHLAADHVVNFTVDAAPAVTTTSPIAAAVAANTSAITLNFSELVNATTSSFALECPAGTPRPFTLSASPASSFTLTPTSTLPAGPCRVTVIASQITDTDTNDPPDSPATNHILDFTVDPAPGVLSTTPVNGAGNQGSNLNLSIAFTEPVNVTGNWFQLVCSTSGTLNVANTVVTGGPANYTVNPNADLAQGESCTVTVFAAQVSDVDGSDPPDVMAANHVFAFSVDAAPSVTSNTPVHGAIVTNLASNIDLTFSEAVNVSGDWFRIACSVSGTRNPAQTSVTGGPTSFTINPTTDFVAGDACTVTVFAAQVTDQDGNDPPDNPTADHSFSFSTEQAPVVSATTPVNGATDLASNTNLSVTFSEPVNVAGNWFQIVCSGSGTRNVGDTNVAGGPTTFTINPATDFTQGESCSVTVFAGQVTDQDTSDPAGFDNLPANHVFGFTIDAAPAVTATTPVNGGLGVATTANVTITFSEPVAVSATDWFQIACSTTGIRNPGQTSVTGGPTVFTINPNVDFAENEGCGVVVFANKVSDLDGNDPPDNPLADYVFNFGTDAAPFVIFSNPPNGGILTNVAGNVDLTFSEPVNVTGNWFQIVCTVSGTRNVADTNVTGGPSDFSINPNTDFQAGDSCTVTVFAAQVADADGNDPPDNPTANHVFSFTVEQPPLVLNTVPAGGSQDIAGNVNLSVTFSEPVNVAGNWFQIVCNTSGTRNVGDTNVTPSGNTFTINPNTDFAAGEGCTVTVFASQVTDQDTNDPVGFDNLPGNYVFSFSIDVAPFVTASTPVNGASGVVLNANLSITFSEPVNVTGDWFQIACATSGTRQPAATVVSGSGTSRTINPNADFVQGEVCTVTVFAAQVTDVDGNDPPDNPTANHVFGFVTDAAPSVVFSSPADGAVVTNLASNIDFTFSENVNVTGNWFQIVCTLSGTRNVSDAGVTGGPAAFTINPNADFQAGDVCTVTVFAAQVADQDGNDPPDNPTANYVINFTVEQAPTVTNTTPANGAVGVVSNANLSITFSEPVNVAGNWFQIVCASSGTRNVADTNVTPAGNTFTINPNTDFTQGESCGVTVFATQVTDQDTNDPAGFDNMQSDAGFGFVIDAAPFVTANTPLTGATGVVLTSDLTITFSETVNVTGDWFQIACPTSGTRLPAATAVSGSGASRTINPNADFAQNETCTVTVFAAQVTDQDGNDPPDNPTGNHVFAFTTDAAPFVASTTPASGGVMTDLAGNLTVNFSEPVNVSGNWFQIVCSLSGTRNVSDTGISGGPVAFGINPNTDFQAGDSCTMTVTAAQVADQDGDDPPDNPTANHVFSFTVEQAPTVTTTVPVDGATSVVLNSDLTINFSEAVNVTGDWFQIACPTSGNRLPAVTVVSGAGASRTINPNVDFAQNETCTVTVFAAQVTDQDTNDPAGFDNMPANHVFSFTTDAAPSVSATTPLNTATGVVLNSNLTITFSEAVNVTGDWFQIACPTSGTRLPAATGVTGGPTTFTIDPNADFAQNETCTVTVFSAQVTDQDGSDPPDNPVANHVFAFTTDVAPFVQSSTPANGAVVTNLSSNIELTFNEAVNVTGNWFQIVCTVSGTRNVADTGVTGGPTTFIIDPNTDFQPGDSCTVTVTAAQVADQDANDPPDNPTANHVFTFTLEQAPTVTTTVPANAATGVVLNSDLTINFSEAVNVSGDWFQIACPTSGNRLPAATVVSGSGASRDINPNADFAQNETCTVTIFAAQVTDQDTNDPAGFDNLPANHVFSFTTDAAPSVIGTTPPDGTSNNPTNVNLTIQFNEGVFVSAPDWFQIVCTVSGTRNPVNTNLSGGPIIWTIDPVTDFTPGESCTTTIFANKVTDLDPNDPPDNMTANHVFTISMDAAPSVTSSTPAHGGSSLLDADLTVTFSEPVSFLPGDWFTLNCTISGNRSSSTATTVSGGPTTWTINPTANFQGGDSCTLTVTGSLVQDVDANDPPNLMSGTYVATFTADSPPTVTSTDPINGATGIALNQVITVNFSENVTVNSSSFQLACPTGTPHALNAPAGSGTNVITLTPSSNYPAGEICTLTVVAANVSDTDGIPPANMAANYVTSFTTVLTGANDSFTATGNIAITHATGTGPLANDGNTGLTVSHVNGASGNVGVWVNTTATGNNGTRGRVKLNADGSFDYDPPPGFTGADQFTYRATKNGVSSGDLTATLTISAVSGELMWFICDACAGGFGEGTLLRPFNSVANFNAFNTGVAPAPQPGHKIYIRSGAYTAFDDRLTLRTTQKVYGQAVAASSAFTPDANSHADFAALTAGTAPTIQPSNTVPVVTLASNNDLHGLILTPASSGADAIQGSAFLTLTISQLRITGPGRALNLTNGTISGDFTELSSTGGANNITLTTVNGGTTGTPLVFGGASDVFSGATGASVNVSGGNISFTRPGGLSQVASFTLLSVAGGHTGALTFSGTVSATAGNGLQFNNADGTYTFSGTTTLNGGDAAIDVVNGSGGTFTFGSGATITNPQFEAVRIESSAPTFSYAGTISKTVDSGPNGMLIQNNTGGSVTFSGSSKAITNASNAVAIINNGSMPVAFTGGGLVLNSVTGGNGLLASNTSLAGNVTVSGTGNTITNAATALSVTNVNIAGGLAFQTIGNVGGGANLIVLNNTGASGILTVAGTGAAGSGGNVGGSVNSVSLTNTQGASLTNMNISATVAGTTFGTLTVSGVSVSSSNRPALTLNTGTLSGTFSTLTSNGSTTHAISLTSVAGTSTASGGTIGSGAGSTGAILISGGNPVFTYSGTILQTAAARLLDVDALAAGGSVTLNGSSITGTGSTGIEITNSAGNVTIDPSAASAASVSTGTGTALNLTSNTGTYTFTDFDPTTSTGTSINISGNGGTYNFTDLDFITTSAVPMALVASGTGNLNITGAGNQILNNAGGGGGAINISDRTLNVTFDNVTATGGANGIALNNVSGTFTTNAGTISGSTSSGLSVTGGSAAVTFNGTINMSNGRPAVVTSNPTGGSLTLGTVNASGTLAGQDAITIDGNGANAYAVTITTVSLNTSNMRHGVALSDLPAGSSLTINGGTITTNGGGRRVINFVTGTTTDGTFNLSGVTLNGTASDGISVGTLQLGTYTFGAFTVNTPSGGIGVSKTGNSAVTFRSISQDGGTTGISLSNAGGSFTIAGNLGTCTLASPNNCTGGTIQNTSSHGVSITNSNGPSLSFVRLLNNNGNGINGTTTNGLSLTSTIIVGAGDADLEGAIMFNSGAANNLTGTATLTSVGIDAPFDVGMVVQNNGLNTLGLTITGSTFQGTLGTVTADELLRLVAGATGGRATITARITGGSTFQNSETDGIFALAQGGAAANTGGTINLTVDGTTLIGGATVGNNSDNGIHVLGLNGGVVRFNINNNSTVRNWRNSTILVRAENNANVQGSITSNTIGTLGTSKSGSFSAYGISLETDDNAQMVATIDNNTIRQTFWSGIAAVIGDGGGSSTQRLDANILTNFLTVAVEDVAGPVIENIMFLNSNVGTACARVTGNDAAMGAGGGGAIGLVGNGTGTFILHGLGGGIDSAATTRLRSDNPLAVARVGAANLYASNNNVWTNGFCSTPASTPTP